MQIWTPRALALPSSTEGLEVSLELASSTSQKALLSNQEVAVCTLISSQLSMQLNLTSTLYVQAWGQQWPCEDE